MQGFLHSRWSVEMTSFEVGRFVSTTAKLSPVAAIQCPILTASEMCLTGIHLAVVGDRTSLPYCGHLITSHRSILDS